MPANYKPYSERVPDTQYRDTLNYMMKEGNSVRTQNMFQTTARHACLTTPNMVFNFENGFPIIPDRDISGFWRRPIAELIAFINGARTLAELKEFGGKEWASWWKRWVTEEKCVNFGLPPGDLGDASYGPGFARFPMPDGGTFNQIENLVRQIRKYPFLSTHKVSPWIPFWTLQHEDLRRKVVVAPCHGDIQVTILEGKLTLRMDQRSADVPIGVPSNILQWAAFTLMLAQVTGYEPYMYIHSLHDAQIYENQFDRMKELVGRKPLRFPTVRINDPTITDIFAFRAEHFELSDYNPHPAMQDIPVTE